MGTKEKWDDGQIDKGIRPVLEVMNRLPHTETTSSCVGHGNEIYGGGMVFFDYTAAGIPEWLNPVMDYVGTNAGCCLGCVSLKIEYDVHFDCANQRFNSWLISMDCRRDMGKRSKIKESREVWALFVKGCEKYLAHEL